MRREQWQSVKDKIESLLEVDAAARPAYLDQIAGDDRELRRELESLLFSKEKMADDFLDLPVYSGQESLLPVSSVIGKRLGPYEIVAEIDQGGMGEVYRALRADDQYHKEVAIKLIRAGRESAFVISRFKNERQILANLEHPNIARLLDGGTTPEGVPYLVMELIEGESIVEYCDRHELGIIARLELFRQVCSAVQFAHQRLIIHRDIKPGNILVTAEGVPKLLDFGISKILGTETESGRSDQTATVLRMLTPAYASPEQVKGEPITTASDVYSLGVVLYELLAGRHPYRSDPRSDQLLREICESEPEKPSTAAKKVGERSDSGASSSSAAAPKLTAEKLSKHLRGDLDNIVLMALRKEPQRRYASVEQFAEDIRRYLGHLPVIARKDTATYSASKFVLRHKAGVAATAIVLLVFLLAFVITIREARIARRQAVLAQEQHARAERRFNDVRKLANSLIFEIHDSIQDLPGATKARELLIKRALEYLDSLSQESADPALQRELATAYERIAFVQGNNASANIADLSGASASYAKGLAIRESLVAANPNDVNLRIELFANYFESFAVLESTGDFDGLLRSLQKAWPLADAVHPGTRERPEFNMSGLHFLTGNALQKKGDFRSALENYQEAARLMEPFALAPQASLRSRWYLAGDHVLIGRMLAELGHASEARSFLDKGLRTLRKLSDENPTNATLREGLGDYYDFSSHALVETGDLEGALALLRLQKRIFDALTSADPGNKMASFDSASVDLDTSEILLRQGKLTKAAPLIRTSLSIYQKANPANKYWYAVTMGQSYLDLGQLNAARAEQGEALSKKRELWKEAVSCYQKALDLRSTGPGQRDFNGHDQFDEIHRELAKATAALARLDN